MNENETYPTNELETEAPKKSGGLLLTVSKLGLGTICGLALITTIMPTCSCADRTTRVEVEQRVAAIEEAIRQQTVQPPAPGHGRTATANE